MPGPGDRRVGHLVDRHPSVSPQRLIARLVPPPTFAGVSFDVATQRRAGKKRLLNSIERALRAKKCEEYRPQRTFGARLTRGDSSAAPEGLAIVRSV